ncbi:MULTISPECIES: PucR family transcriptional regulator [unclassified Streptomyces]|uniref:PucR family transcriptional regulator n=1 Tax=unclassified Streptomyces TaxID=2593676 RepID=UPI00081E2F47|nr:MULTISPECIES: PucR family transcriptional regulator [unclassified Streptomyces]MYR94051.1 PucR family transcriptional regulator [Streptomyces sp. SID4937]SCD64337.1 PucR C-terminal helix-turn-helix domain-containing protein [Streptomyces sp. ScaeMP-e83]
MPPPPAHSPGPPAPPIPLAELLAREELGLRRIAGPAEAELLWVHTSEMADPYPYLLGGELLLSAGVLLTDPDHYVGRLVEAGAAALGFGVRPVHETVPEALIEACDRYGLPLLEVPPETPFTTIARAVWRLMAEARHRELRRVTRAQQALATAAARPDPVPAVLHQLATQLSGRAVLLTARGEEVHAAGRRPPPKAAAALARLARVVARERPGSPASATDTLGATHLSAYALGGGEGLALTLATSRREAGDHTVAGVAVVLLSLLTAPHQGADAAARSAALVRLLLGATPGEVAPLLDGGGADGGQEAGAPWTVIHARRTDGMKADALTAGALGASLGSALVDAGREDDDTVRVLLPAAAREAAREQRPAPAQAPTVSPQPGWTLGVSTPTPPSALTTADLGAARALAHAEATRTPLKADAPITGLAALIPPDRAAAHARTLLAPLTPPLAETLRCWLSLHGSWDRTAVALAVHRNTVRQRIGRCAELLAMDLNDMDVRTELWFALRQE